MKNGAPDWEKSSEVVSMPVFMAFVVYRSFVPSFMKAIAVDLYDVFLTQSSMSMSIVRRPSTVSFITPEIRKNGAKGCHDKFCSWFDYSSVTFLSTSIFSAVNLAYQANPIGLLQTSR